MDREQLARVICDALDAQEEYCDEHRLDEVVIDGWYDLLKVADTVLEALKK